MVLVVLTVVGPCITGIAEDTANGSPVLRPKWAHSRLKRMRWVRVLSPSPLLFVLIPLMLIISMKHSNAFYFIESNLGSLWDQLL